MGYEKWDYLQNQFLGSMLAAAFGLAGVYKDNVTEDDAAKFRAEVRAALVELSANYSRSVDDKAHVQNIHLSRGSRVPPAQGDPAGWPPPHWRRPEGPQPLPEVPLVRRSDPRAAALPIRLGDHPTFALKGAGGLDQDRG